MSDEPAAAPASPPRRPVRARSAAIVGAFLRATFVMLLLALVAAPTFDHECVFHQVLRSVTLSEDQAALVPAVEDWLFVRIQGGSEQRLRCQCRQDGRLSTTDSAITRVFESATAR